MFDRTIGRILPVVSLAAILVVGLAPTGNAAPYGGNSGANAGMGGGFNCGKTTPVYPPGYGQDCGPSGGYVPKQHATKPAAPTTQPAPTDRPTTPPQTQN